MNASVDEKHTSLTGGSAATVVTAASVESAVNTLPYSSRMQLFRRITRSSLQEDVARLVTSAFDDVNSATNASPAERACIAADLVLSIFHTRAVRGWGLEVKGVFLTAFLAIHRQFPVTGISLIRIIPQYGCWKDLLQMCAQDGVPADVEDKCLEIFADQLRVDEQHCDSGGGISFAAKWAPAEKRSHDKQKQMVDRLCALLYPFEYAKVKEAIDDGKKVLYGLRKRYRLLLRKLKNKLKDREVARGSKKWPAKESIYPAQLDLAEHHPYVEFRKTIDAHYFNPVRQLLADSEEGVFSHFSNSVYDAFRLQMPCGIMQIRDLPLPLRLLNDLVFDWDYVFTVKYQSLLQEKRQTKFFESITQYLRLLDSPSRNMFVRVTRNGKVTLGVMACESVFSFEPRLKKLYRKFRTLNLPVVRETTKQRARRMKRLGPTQYEIDAIFAKYATYAENEHWTLNTANVFRQACHRKDIDSVRMLLRRDVVEERTFGSKGIVGESFLSAAVKQGSSEMVKVLMAESTFGRKLLHACDISGETPFILAAKHGEIEMVHTFLQYKPPIDDVRFAREWAFQNKGTQIVSLLNEHLGNARVGWTPGGSDHKKGGWTDSLEQAFHHARGYRTREEYLASLRDKDDKYDTYYEYCD